MISVSPAAPGPRTPVAPAGPAGPVRAREVLAAGAAYAVLGCLVFAPAMALGRLLGASESWFVHLPDYLTPVRLWQPNLLTGHPALGDPEVGAPSAVVRLLATMPGTWNLCILLLYVIAATGAHGLARRLGACRTGATVAALAWGFGTPLVFHLEHLSLLAAAAWLPWALWGVESVLRRPSPRRTAAAGCALALLATGGHPQVPLYGAVLLAAWIVVRARAAGRMRAPRLASAGLAVLVGLGLAGWFLVPLVEQTALSVRGNPPATHVADHPLHPVHLVTAFAPRALGGGDLGPWRAPGRAPESMLWLGPSLLPLVAAAIAWRRRRSPAVLLAACAAGAVTLGVLLATPAAETLHRVPVLRSFRVHARVLVPAALCLSVLMGLGVTALRHGDRRRMRAVLAWSGPVSVIAAGAALVVALLLRPPSGPVALEVTAGPGVVAAGALAAVAWHRRPGPRSGALLVGLTAVCLVTAAWAAPWRGGSRTPADLAPHPVAADPALGDGGRHTVITHRPHRLAALAPNTHLPLGLTEVGGRSSWRSLRTDSLLRPRGRGTVDPALLRPDSHVLDLFGVDTVITPVREWMGAGDFRRAGLPWSRTFEVVALRAEGEWRSWTMPVHPMRADRIGLVSHLEFATRLPPGTVVGEVLAHGTDGRTERVLLRAGVHTAEWSLDRERPGAAGHGPAPVFDSWTVRGGDDGTYRGRQYLAVLPLPGVMTVESLEVRCTTGGLTLALRQASLGGPDGDQHVPCRTSALRDPDRWRPLRRVEDVMVLRNRRARPRAWRCSRAEPGSSAAHVDVIRGTADLRDAPFDPATTVLLEDQLHFSFQPDPDARTRVVTDEPGRLVLRTTGSRPAVLVVADAHHPGWTGWIDGARTAVLPANVGQRAVLVPAGDATVEFRFEPRSWTWGVRLSLVSLAAALLLALLPRRRGRRLGGRR